MKSSDDTDTRSAAQALDDFLADNGFTTQSYDAPTVAIPIGPLTIPLPNTEGRKKVVRLHDLHHVATGYHTDLIGEAEIGAWELRAGCTTLAAWFYNGMAVALGLALGPRRVWRAFREARGHRTLYRLGRPYEQLLAMPLSELREALGIPAGGLR
jgi:hypothetical protein